MATSKRSGIIDPPDRLDLSMLDRDIHNICELYLALRIVSTGTTLEIRSLHLNSKGEEANIIM